MQTSLRVFALMHLQKTFQVSLCSGNVGFDSKKVLLLLIMNSNSVKFAIFVMKFCIFLKKFAQIVTREKICCKDLASVRCTCSIYKKAQLTQGKGDARQQCVHKDSWQIILSSSMLPVDGLLIGRILLIVCDIFLWKEAENRHFGR